MASFSINASMLRACSSYRLTSKEQSQARPARSLGIKLGASFGTLNVEGQKALRTAEEQHGNVKVFKNGIEAEPSIVKFFDERWKNGTWDLNMFVKSGKMDWNSLIVAEARRRKFLELYPEAATNEDPVLFRSSIIPWWAWMTHSHLPEAELLNGRAAMVGFFMAYLVDVLTGLDVVGQSGNFICKTGLFVTVISILLFRRRKSFKDLKNLADEATFYDKQWQASRQGQDANGGAPGRK